MADEVQYDKPNSLLDLEARKAEGYVPPSQLGVAKEPDESALNRGGFIGVDPVYQNAANETERPMRQTEGAEADLVSDAGQDENLPKFDDESPLPVVDPEKDPLVTDASAASGGQAPTPVGKSDAMTATATKRTTSTK